MIYFCCDERRRNAVAKHDLLNGIDFLEVRDDPSLPVDERQRTLFVHFVKALAPDVLDENHVRIEGGERTRGVLVTDATVGTGDEANVLTVQVNKAGDFSIYTLRLVASPTSAVPPDHFDMLLSKVDFTFKVECASDFDCMPEHICPPETLAEPEIDYLAKDYASFRRLMLDRMAMVMPEWRERNPADLGIVLVELLAHVGDHLSYQQDAAATEGYLGTARRRVSVRRHARLVDYFMHDGSNARVWVQVQVEAPHVKLERGARLLTQVSGPQRIPPDSRAYDQAMAQGPEIFETMHEATLFNEHNSMTLFTWGERECCLPKGATRAFLKDDEEGRLVLRPGDVLIFEERLGPSEGVVADADPSHRHAVRLTRVHPEAKLSENEESENEAQERAPGDLVVDLPTGQAYVEIEWSPEDALPFPLCISAMTNRGLQEDVSVVLGNIVLADHGRTIENEELGTVPEPAASRALPIGGDHCRQRPRTPVFPRFRPRLKERPLTQAGMIFKTEVANGQKHTHRLPFDPEGPAAAAFQWEMKNVLPAVTLDAGTWQPRRDLLASNKFAREFVVEVEEDGAAFLRFGDDRNGSRPTSGSSFTATYRVGNGVAGHVGAEAIAHVVSDEPAIARVRNPLPARGGVEPESMEDVRQKAPSAFRTQKRAVTEADYAEVTGRHLQVQKSEASLRWTGSWHTVFVTVDRMGGSEMNPAFREEVRQHVERFRMAGHDLQVDEPRFVSLEVAMHVCAKPDYFRGDVKAALLAEFSNRILPGGRRGVFHPDNFSFGQPVYLSRLYAAAQRVPGVASVNITRFQRQGRFDEKVLADGKLSLSRLEIARLDNDPNFAEHGVFMLDVEGGK
jgi:hypothetical protein